MFNLLIFSLVILKTGSIVFWMIAEIRAYFAREAPAE